MHCGFVHSRDSSMPPPSVHPSVSASHIHPTHILPISDHNSLSDKRVTTASTCGFYLHPILLDLYQATASLTVSFASQMSWVDPYSQPPFESFTVRPRCERPTHPLCVWHSLKPSSARLTWGGLYSWTPLWKASYHCDGTSAYIIRRR